MINKRPNKLAQGFTKNEARRERQKKTRISNPMHPLYNSDLGKLIVHGTTDELAKGVNFNFKRVTKQHPTDFGYTKQVYVLSDFGKAKLKRMKREKELIEREKSLSN